MDIQTAQRENRIRFVGGFYGQLVSAMVWLAGASLATWSTPRAAITTMVVSGFFIFAIVELLLRIFEGPRPPLSANPLSALGMQVAFVLPLSMPVLLGVGRYRLEWFMPATAILVGAHYLPFVFLYGMRMFAVLCALLVGGGVAIVMYGIGGFSTAAWYTTAVLLVFAFLGRFLARREARAATA